MKRYNGNYVDEFNDSEYKQIVSNWQNIVKSMADSFYNTQLDFGASTLKVKEVSHEPNRLLIDRAVINAISDIKRAKDYHLIGKPSTLKYASYIGFWLERAKPFALKVTEYDSIPIKKSGILQKAAFNFCFSINEVFTAEFMCAIAYSSMKNLSSLVSSTCEICLDLCKKENYLILPSQTMLDSLHYFLCYRHYNAQSLEMFLKGLLSCPVEYVASQKAD